MAVNASLIGGRPPFNAQHVGFGDGSDVPHGAIVQSTAASIAAFAASDVPVIDRVVDNHGMHQGVVDNGGYTDDAYPTFMGKADPGVKVHVYRGRYLQGSVVADTNGDWVFTPSTPLATGKHSITIVHEYPNTATSEESLPYVITVDRVAPAMPEVTSVTDDQGRIIGLITDQAITDDNQPTIHGTAEAHAKLIVYDRGKEIGSTTVNDDGTWSFTPDMPLDDGLHVLSYSAVDRAGNSSEQTGGLEFHVDTRPEKVSIYFATDDVGSVTGDLFNGSVTDDNTPALVGSATAGGVVKIYIGQVLLGQTTAGVDGFWEFAPATALGEGTHTFHATVTLPAKGESELSNSFSLTINALPPEKPSIDQVLDDVGAVKGALKSGDTTDDNKPTLIGKGEPGATLKVYDGGKLLGSVPVDSNGNWTFTPNTALADGAHKFTAIAVDSSGNSSVKSNAINLTVSTSISVYKPLAVDLNGGAPQGLTQCYMIKTGTAPAQTYRIYVNGNLQEEVTLGSWVNWNSRIWWTNAKTQVFRLVVVKEGHEIEVDSHTGSQLMSKTSGPDGHIMLNNQLVTFNPAARGASSFIVGDETFESSGHFTSESTANSSLAAGGLGNSQSDEVMSGSVLGDQAGAAVSDSDAGRNVENKFVTESGAAAEVEEAGSLHDAPVAAVPFAVGDVPVIDKMVDTRGAITGVIENGGYTDDSYPTISGKADPGVKVHVYRGKYLQGSVVADANGEWVFTPSTPFATGKHSITVIHEYPNTATSQESEPYVITVDRVAPPMPKITGILDDEGRITGSIGDQTITDDNLPTITGTAEANATLVVYDKGKLIGSTTVEADGTWSFTPATPLADGLHILSYSAVDRAGNVGQQTDVTEFIVDTRPEKISIHYAEDDAGGVLGEIYKGGVTDDSTPTLFGTATAGGIVKIYEGDSLLGEATADVDGTWVFRVPALSEGTHTFHATVTLIAKGESERSMPFNLAVDDTPPETPTIDQVWDNVGLVQGLVEDGKVTDDANPTLSGKAEGGSTVHIYCNGTLLNSVVADADGRWVYAPTTSLLDQTYSFTVKAEDNVGNLSAESNAFVIIVDTLPPGAPSILAAQDNVGVTTGSVRSGGTTDDSTPTLKGVAGANTTVIILDHGTEVGRVQANAQGNWSFTPETPLANISHSLTAQALDEIGKLSEPSDPFFLQVEAISLLQENFQTDAEKLLTEVGDTVDSGLLTMTLMEFFPGYSGPISGIGPGSKGKPSGMMAMYVHGSVVKVDLNSGIKAAGMSFTMGDSQSTQTIDFYDDTGALIMSQKLAMPAGPKATYAVSIDMPEGKMFSYFVVTPGIIPDLNTCDYIELDEFVFKAVVPGAVVETPKSAEDFNVGIFSGGDTLVDVGSDAIMRAGPGDDVLRIVGTDFALLDGGSGNDTLVLDGQFMHLDLSAMGGRLQGFEKFDLGGGGNQLSLGISDLLAAGANDVLTTDGKLQLVVNGTSGEVNLHGNGNDWMTGGTISVGDVTYEVFSNLAATAELLVEEGIQVWGMVLQVDHAHYPQSASLEFLAVEASRVEAC